MALEYVPYSRSLPYMFPLFAEEWETLQCKWELGFYETIIDSFKLFVHEELLTTLKNTMEEVCKIFSSPDTSDILKGKSLNGAELVFYYLYSKLEKVPLNAEYKRRFAIGIYLKETVVESSDYPTLMFTGDLKDLVHVGALFNKFTTKDKVTPSKTTLN